MRRKQKALLKKCVGLVSCGLLIMPQLTSAASALTVVDDAKSAAERMRNEAKAIADYQQSLVYLALAKDYVALAEQNLTEAQTNEVEANRSFADAEQWRKEGNDWLYQANLTLQEAEKALSKMGDEAELHRAADALRGQLAEAIGRIERLNAEKTGAITGWQAKLDEASERVAKQALEAIGYDESRLEEAEDRVEQAVSGYQRGLDDAETAYEARLEAAEEERSALEESLDAAEDRLAMFRDVQADLNSAAADAEAASKNFADALKNLHEATTYVEEARAYMTQATEDYADSQRDLAEAEKALFPVERSRYAQGEMKYYSWRDNQGRKGSQLYQPYQFYALEKDMEYGIQTAYLSSDNQSFADGKMSGFIDTTLSVAQKVRKQDYLLTYGIDIGLPTGKSKMKPNAAMSDDLVSQSRFGDGYTYTPRVSVSHKIGEEDTWTFGTSYGFKKSYDDETGLVDPGGEWAKSIEWLHAGQAWQALAVLTHSDYGLTRRDGLTYHEGNQWATALYYNRVLSPKQDIMVYYRFDIGDATKYDDVPDFADLDGTQYRRYYGVEWKNAMTPNRALRLMFNVMRATGKHYDPLTRLTSDSRHKYSGLIGYDIRIDERSEVSLELEQFYMKDKAGASYHGHNVYLKYSRNF